MRRSRRVLPVVFLVAMSSVTTAPASASSFAPPAIPSAFAARFLPNNFLGGTGSAVSRLDLLLVGGSVTVELRNRPPGEHWELLLYDQGNCNAVQHVVITMPSLVIGPTGSRFERIVLSVSQRQAVIRAFTYRARLALRLSSGTYHTCRRYFPLTT